MRKGQKRDRARELRRDMTLAERRLWTILQGRQVDGHRFRRQCPVGPYIADFACLESGVVIEVDGGQHMDSSNDVFRDRHMRDKGLCVLRFWNNDVLENLEGVRAAIAACLADRREPPPQPSPLERGRERIAATAGSRGRQGSRRKQEPRGRQESRVAAPSPV